MGQINDLVARCHGYAKRQGFWGGHDARDVTVRLSKLALIHTEVSEACEAVRRDDSENLAEEIADTVIRCLDFAGACGVNLELAITDKMAKNEKREPMHGKLA